MTYPATRTAPPPARPRGLLITGVVLVVLSIVVVIGCAIWAATTIADATTQAPTFETPGEVTTTLDAGPHAIWTNSAFLSGEDVTITGPGGEVTATDYLGGDGVASLAKDGTSFSPEVVFDAPTTGPYTVAIDERGPSTDVLVGPPANIVSKPFTVVAIAFLVSSLIGLTGVILFIVGLVRRSRAKRSPGPPPGASGAPGPFAPPAYGQPSPVAPPGAPGGPPGSGWPPGPPGMGPPLRP